MGRMKKAVRRRVALLFGFVIAFAQIAVAAQPWPLDIAPHRHTAPASAAADHCAGHLAGDHGVPAPKAPTPNHCEVHCQDATQPDAVAIAIAAPIADAWLAVSLVLAIGELAPPVDALLAKCASPPARVLYSRFLN
jgi:hypothetical protein